MKKQLKKFLLVPAILIFSYAFAGERHSGNGPTREAAAAAADARAKTAARKKGTCITEAKLEECKQESDGSWTCYASSANHAGSCSDLEKKAINY